MAMDTQSLYQQISNYDQWKRALGRQLERFQGWSREHGALSPDISHSIERARRLLQVTQGAAPFATFQAKAQRRRGIFAQQQKIYMRRLTSEWCRLGIARRRESQQARAESLK